MMRFSTLLVNILEQCNIRCRHCGFVGSDRRGLVQAEDLVDWVQQAVAYGIPQITFSGGEPFLQFDLLKQGVEAVHRSGGASGVFTNGYWGDSAEAAERLLGQLPGLTHLYISCDTYHLEWVPLERVLHVIEGAGRADIPQVIVCVTSTTDEQAAQVSALFAGLQVEFYHTRVIPAPPVREQVPDAADALPPFVPANFSRQCYLHTPLVHTTGKLWACHIGAAEAHGNLASDPYCLGDLHQDRLAHILQRAEEDEVYQFLRACGPRAVAEAAVASKLGSQLEQQAFASDCDMCYQVLTRQEVLAEVRRRAGEADTRRRVFLRRVMILGDDV